MIKKGVNPDDFEESVEDLNELQKQTGIQSDQE